MNKREVTEIKRRFKKESCTISSMCGCYVNGEKEKVTTFRHTFLNLEEEEFYKYLEIANKSLSGTLGDNLLELSFPLAEEESGGKQHILMALRACNLEDEALLDRYYDLIIESYDYVGNYLIVLFHDTYDVPMKTTDELALGESEEIYDYIICAICPVTLSKPGLGYRKEENRIGARLRDWVVGATDTAFTFPCFTDRSADIHSVLLYTKDTKEPHHEFWENCLGCTTTIQTATEKRNAFTNMLTQAFGPEGEDTSESILDVQQNLEDYIALEEERQDKDDPISLEPEIVEELLTDSGMEESKATRVKDAYTNYFGEDLPLAKELLDNKAVKQNQQRQEKKTMQEKIVSLTKQLEDAGFISSEGKEIDVVVKVPPHKASYVDFAFVDGRKCLVIPMEEDEAAKVNGEERHF